MIIGEQVQVERTEGPGYWNDIGEFVGGDTRLIALKAAVQPATGKNAQLLPEGRRIEDAVMVFTERELVVGTKNQKADVLIFRGRRFEIWNVKQWPAAFFPHYEVMALAELA